MVRVLNSITIEHPLLFLCGPLLGERKTDRRILYKNSVTPRNKPVTLVPVIVDPFFAQDATSPYGLDVALLEEILASVAFHTDIFLDSLSTSYEFGLFSNFRSENGITLLLDKKYDERVNNRVGQFLLISKRAPQVHYPADYNPKGYIFFKGNTVPKELHEHIDDLKKEAVAFSKKVFPIRFFDSATQQDADFSCFINNFGGGAYKYYCTVKTFFYLVALFSKQKRTSQWYGINQITIEECSKYIGKLIDNSYAFSLRGRKRALHFYKERIGGPEVVCSDVPDSYKLIKHCLFILSIFEKKPKDKEEKAKFPAFNPYTDGTFNVSWENDPAIIDCFKEDGADIICDYSNCPERYVTKTIVTIRGKKRRIIQYKENSRGYELRKAHKRIAASFDTLFYRREGSFAYRPGKNAGGCVEKHLKSKFFLKLDIHHFFESIRISRISRLVLNLDSPWRDGINSVSNSLKICFHKGRLPLGYCSSPIISDAYMSKFDDEVGELCKLNGCVYTRYADDIMISTANNGQILLNIEDQIIEKLSAMGFSLNAKKRVFKALKNDGDTIKYLGLLIKIGTNGVQTIVVPNSYLKNLSLELDLQRRNGNSDGVDACLARARYIKSVSNESYHKLCRLYLIKTGRDLVTNKKYHLLNLIL